MDEQQRETLSRHLHQATSHDAADCAGATDVH